MKSKLAFYLLVFASFISATSAKVHFKSWFGQFRDVFESIMEHDCQDEYEKYLSGVAPKDFLSLTITPTIDCILKNLNETRMSNMAAAAVVLGLLPTTLGLAGSTTMEIGLVALRRPFLAFLLAAGAPAVSPIRTFDYVDPKELLRKTPYSKALSMGRRKYLVALLQYVGAAAAIVNLVFVSYQVCIRTVCSFAPEDAFLPALWASLVLAIHLFGSLSVHLRVKIIPIGPDMSTSRRDRLWHRILRDRILREITPSAARGKAKLVFKDETYTYIFLAWFTCVGTVLHIICGTLIFSSILFISTSDAVTVVSRYLSSTLLCRAVLMFELSGLRQVVDEGDFQSGQEFMPMEENHGGMPLSHRPGSPQKEGFSSHVKDTVSLLRH